MSKILIITAGQQSGKTAAWARQKAALEAAGHTVIERDMDAEIQGTSIFDSVIEDELSTIAYDTLPAGLDLFQTKIAIPSELPTSIDNRKARRAVRSRRR